MLNRYVLFHVLDQTEITMKYLPVHVSTYLINRHHRTIHIVPVTSIHSLIQNKILTNRDQMKIQQAP